VMGMRIYNEQRNDSRCCLVCKRDNEEEAISKIGR
jgi:hypothetical protein